MCSINGYVGEIVGDGRGFDILIRSQEYLKYRGYDSWGVATNGTRNGEKARMHYLKGTDKKRNIREIYEKEYDSFNLYMQTGIAHNRWATHGKPTLKNAHPHLDCNEKIAVIHNGIIYNYKELYKKYPGHTIRSETDSEIIPHLIEEYMKKGLEFEDAFAATVNEFKGSTYAIAAINVEKPDIIMAARQCSPLIIGLGDNENLVSSDIVSLLNYTDEFIRLKNGDTAKITKDSVEIYNNGYVVDREIKKINDIPQGWFENTDMDLFSDKGEVKKDITLFEIGQQTGIDKSGHNTMKSALNQDKDNISEIIKKLKGSEKIILTGSGSSYNAAIYGELLLSELGYTAYAMPACHLELYKKAMDQDTTVIVLSQSGETMDLIVPLTDIKGKNNPCIVSMTNVPFNTISEEIAEYNISLNDGAERAVAATKSFTSQLTLLRYLSYGLGKQSNNIYNLDERLDEGEKIIRECIDKISEHKYMFQQADYFASNLASADNIIILGEGIHYSIAREAALKFEELTRIPTKAYESGEIKHGPLAMIGDRGDQFDRNMIVIAISPQDDTYESTQNAIRQIRSHGGRVFELTDADDGQADNIMNCICPESGDSLEIPTLLYYENAETIYFQHLAHDVAKLRHKLSKKPSDEEDEYPWDTPNNLAKSITVE